MTRRNTYEKGGRRAGKGQRHKRRGKSLKRQSKASPEPSKKSGSPQTLYRHLRQWMTRRNTSKKEGGGLERHKRRGKSLKRQSKASPEPSISQAHLRHSTDTLG